MNEEPKDIYKIFDDYINVGISYFKAAELLARSTYMHPFNTLIGHSIEMGLKGLLILGTDLTPEILQTKKYGHNLKVLFNKSKECFAFEKAFEDILSSDNPLYDETPDVVRSIYCYHDVTASFYKKKKLGLNYEIPTLNSRYPKRGVYSKYTAPEMIKIWRIELDKIIEEFKTKTSDIENKKEVIYKIDLYKNQVFNKPAK